MLKLRPSLDERDASEKLDQLVSASINAADFKYAKRKLQRSFEVFSNTCPLPFIAPGQVVITEIRQQSELYLPLAEITRIYNRFFSAALDYPPIFSSTPFHRALSWADVFAGLPSLFQFTANPANLLKKLLEDRQLLTEFLFYSFLPDRFYGGFERYPEQSAFVRQWIPRRHKKVLRCLDAACGTGEDSYGLAKLLLESGYESGEISIEGWTIEPLEVWAAAYCRFPHDRQREFDFREETSSVFENGFCSCLQFVSADLLTPPSSGVFDLILCNGLLGGPIFNKQQDLELVAGKLVRLLAPQGILLVADSFHQGWKRKCPQRMLRALFESYGLSTCNAGEGFAAEMSGYCPDVPV